MKIYLLLLSTSLFLASCLPAIFTATTTATIAVAGDRTAGEAIDDVKLTAKIKGHIAKEGFRNLYTKLSVTVIEGRVLYTGMVNKEEDLLKAIEIAWSYPGVKEVACEAKVDKNSNHFDLAQYTRDTMITAQIKFKAFSDRTIKFVNYTVITVNDIVYIFGIARSQEELEKISEIAAKVQKVQKVISHVKLKETKHDQLTNDDDA